MTTPTAFRATFSDLKLVKTRQVAQLIFEIPLSDFDAAYEVLGGMPNPASERWFAVAPLVAHVVEKSPKRDWRDIQPAQQAGIRSNEPQFWAFMREQKNIQVNDKDDAAVAIREACGVHSRTEFSTDQRKRVLWHQLDTEYQAWLAKENA